MNITPKIRTQIRSALRKIWSWGSEEKKQTIKRARKGIGKYECEVCNKIVKKIEVDHIVPIGATPGSRVSTKEDTWDSFINKLFCSTDNLQGICSKCHKEKTKSDRKRK
jgi:5-methylcytosine-specific restriction endonuclease McrA